MDEMDKMTTNTPDRPAPAWTRRRFIALMGKIALASGAVLVGIGAHNADARCNPSPSCYSCGCPYGNVYGNPYCCYSGNYVYVIAPCYFPNGGPLNCYAVCQQQECAFSPER